MEYKNRKYLWCYGFGTGRPGGHGPAAHYESICKGCSGPIWTHFKLVHMDSLGVQRIIM